MSLIRSVVDALHSGDPARVTAATLGRIWQHYAQRNEMPFVVITSWRHTTGPSGQDKVSYEVNQARLKELEATLRSKGFGFSQIVGHWVECQAQGIPYDQCPKDQLVDVIEPALFVPGLDKSTALSLARKYEQDGFLYAGPDTDGNVLMVQSAGGEYAVGSRFSLQGFQQAFSELATGRHRGRKFVFATYTTSSPTEAQAAALYEDRTYGYRLYNCLTGGRLRTDEDTNQQVAKALLAAADSLTKST